MIDSVLSAEQELRLHLDVAAGSDNPTLIDAVQQVVVLVRLADPVLIAELLDLYRSMAVVRSPHHRAKLHALIDVVLDGDNDDAFVALENLVDVAVRPRR